MTSIEELSSNNKDLKLQIEIMQSNLQNQNANLKEDILFDGKNAEEFERRTEKDLDIVSSTINLNYNNINIADLDKKLERYKKKIENKTIEIESSLQQIAMLKGELKEQKLIIEELKALASKLIDSSKAAEKKVYEETVKTLREKLNIEIHETKKTGFGFFKSKN